MIVKATVIVSVALASLAGCASGTAVACLGEQKIYENQTGANVSVWAIFRNHCGAPYTLGGSGLNETVPPGGDRVISITVPNKSFISVTGPATRGTFEYEIKEVSK